MLILLESLIAVSLGDIDVDKQAMSDLVALILIEQKSTPFLGVFITFLAQVVISQCPAHSEVGLAELCPLQE